MLRLIAIVECEQRSDCVPVEKASGGDGVSISQSACIRTYGWKNEFDFIDMLRSYDSTG